MKKLLLSVLCVVLMSCDSEKTTAKLELNSMQCLMCSYGIEKTILEMRGVKKANIDLRSKSGSVIFNAGVIDLSKIEDRIVSMGYSVNGKKANPEAYDRLEPCCKKPKEN